MYARARQALMQRPLSRLMPLRQFHVRQQAKRGRSALLFRFSPTPTHLTSERFTRQFEGNREFVDGLALKESVSGSHLGRREIKQTVNQILRERFDRSQWRGDQNSHSGVQKCRARNAELESNGPQRLRSRRRRDADGLRADRGFVGIQTLNRLRKQSIGAGIGQRNARML